MNRSMTLLFAMMAPLAGCAALSTTAVSGRPTEQASGNIRCRNGNSCRPSTDAATATKPRLTVWTSADCPSCRHFWSDLACDRNFREDILTRFHLQRINVDVYRTAAETRGINSVPTFELADRKIRGYGGTHQLWQRLAEAAADSLSPASIALPLPDSNKSPTGESLKPLPPLARPKQRHGAETSASTNSQINPAPSITKPNGPQAQQLPRISNNTDQQPSFLRRLGAFVYRSAPVVLTGLELAGILGSSAATGGLGTIAVAALWRFLKHRRLRTRNLPAGTTQEVEQLQPREEADRATTRAPFPRQLDEARELLAIRQSEGRVATLDALRGMFLDDELAKLGSSSNETEGAVANKLKTAIDTRVDEVAPLSTTIG